MKRFGCLVVLLALGSSAHAGELSFMIGGHRVRVDAPKGCRSASCLSVSIPGIYSTVYASHRARGDDDVAVPFQPAAAKPPIVAPTAAPSPAQTATPPKAAPIVTPISKPAIQTAATIPAPPPTVVLAASTAQQVPPPPKIEPVTTASVAKPPVETPVVIAQSVPEVAPAPVTVAQETENQTESEPADTPLGDWQTEGKTGLVRIERCGGALCGYMLDPATSAKGETVLINMKPKHDSEWSGGIYSRASGNTYYGTMAMKQPNRLRVEACAVGAFFCSGNDWTRVEGKLRELITSRRVTPPPRS